MRVSFVTPIMPMVVVQAMNFTPRSCAVSRSSAIPGMRLRCMTRFIMLVPNPPK